MTRTRMKRGFSSQYGAGIAIDILTGRVIDFEVMSLYCHGCVEADHKVWAGGASERLEWEEQHATDCCKNFTGSPKSGCGRWIGINCATHQCYLMVIALHLKQSRT